MVTMFDVPCEMDAFCNDIVFLEEIRYILMNFPITEFWETGSYIGCSTDFIKRMFPQLLVYSCDASADYIVQAQKRNSSVMYKVSKSTDFLHERISKFTTPPFVYLDAHGHGHDFPLQEELSIIGNSEKSFFLCVHDCKIPGKLHSEFQFDSYGGMAITTGLVNYSLSKTNCCYIIYAPNTTKYNETNIPTGAKYFGKVGRCYVLINPTMGPIITMRNELFVPLISYKGDKFEGDWDGSLD